MIAGFISSYVQNNDLLISLKRGIATATFVISNKAIFTLSDVEKLSKEIILTKIY